MSVELLDHQPYRKREEWNDVKPIFHDDIEKSVVNIAYSEQFAEVFAYFRAILTKDERSERAFQLTTDAVKLNPANYTAWHFRRLLLIDLKKELQIELSFIGELIRENPKNYQVWHHRRLVVEMLKDSSQELDFAAELLNEDAKNYHAWQHRQWVVKEFSLYKGELDYCNLLLAEDVRNNSAWNHRYFVITSTTGYTAEVLQAEVNLTMEVIKKVPQNESSWEYLAGILIDNLKYPGLWEFCEGLYGDSEAGKSAYLLVFMIDCLEERLEKSGEKKTVDETNVVLQRVKELTQELIKVDPMRQEYWRFLERNLHERFEGK